MNAEEIYRPLGVSPQVCAFGERVLDGLRERFAAVDRIAEANQAKVLAAMQKNRVSAACFAATTGYGMTTSAAISSSASMPTRSTPRLRSCGRRSPAARMP